MDFHEKFKNYSNSELLYIIDHPTEFQPLAVEAATSIFSGRQLSAVDIELAKKELAIQQQEKNTKNEQKKAFEHKVKNIGFSLVDAVNPIQKKAPTGDRTINIISIIVGGLFLYRLFSEFRMIQFMFTSVEAKWDLSTAVYFLPLILTLLAAVLFYARKKSGWVLLSIYLVCSAANALFAFLIALISRPSEILALDSLYPRISPVTHIGTIFFFIGILWVVSKKHIREIYNVSKKEMVSTIAITAMVIALLLVYANAYY